MKKVKYLFISVMTLGIFMLTSCALFSNNTGGNTSTSGNINTSGSSEATQGGTSTQGATSEASQGTTTGGATSSEVSTTQGSSSQATSTEGQQTSTSTETSATTPVSKVNVIFYNGSSIYTTVEVNVNSKVTLPEAPTKEGHEFLNWCTDQGLSSDFNTNTLIQTETKLYAKFSVNTYQVTFKDGTEVLDTKTVNYNNEVELFTPTKTGYDFGGWYTDSGLTTSFVSTTKITEPITLYAKFTIKTFQVTVMDGSSTFATVNVNYNESPILDANPEKNGYQFTGYYTDPGLSNPFDTTTKITDSITIYIGFLDASSVTTVVFNDTIGDGAADLTKPIGYTLSSSELPVLEKNGYQFEGWYLDSGFNTLFVSQVLTAEPLNLYAKWSEAIPVSKIQGANEVAYILFTYDTDATYEASYKLTSKSTYNDVASELIRHDSTSGRIDILGLTPGSYDFKLTKTKDNKESYYNGSFEVYAQDRSGYAHNNYTDGVGAYNDDGTLKAGADIIYVSDATKNTVTYNGKTGIVQILANLKNSSNPVCIRFLDMVKTTQWDSKTYSSYSSSAILADYGDAESEGGKYYIDKLLNAGANTIDTDLANGITTLEGLEKFSYGTSSDSYWNMCDIQNASNITIEGVGENAGLFQWGLNWKNCSKIEIKNLLFDKYTEDACSFEGSTDSETLSDYADIGRYWVHNNTFTQGLNRWDVSDDQDKHEGDGATDFKRTGNITLSYNHYIENHKTGLIGSDDGTYTANVTFHHNYYEGCNSRMPLGRNANMHMYNNYYYGSTGTNMSIRARGYAFVENSVFENCKNPVECKQGTRKEKSGSVVYDMTAYTGKVKSYNNTFTNCTGSNNATIVTDREDTVSNSCSYGTTFDKDPSIFYYDSENHRSNVTVLNDTADVKAYVLATAGHGAGFYYVDESNLEKHTVTYNFLDENNNTISQSQTRQVTDGKSAPEVNLSIPGYSFKGYYTTSGSSYSITTPITTDTTINVVYQAKEAFTVTFVSYVNNLEETIDTVTVYEGDTVTRPTTDPTKDGYTFDDWYTSSSFTDEFDFTEPITGETKIYANFNEYVEGQELFEKANASTPSSGTIFDVAGITVTITGTADLVEKSTTSVDGKYTFTHAVLPGGGGRTYTVRSTTARTIVVYYTIADSSWADQNKQLVVDGTTVTSYSSSNKCPGTTPVAYELTLAANTDCIISASGSRLVIWGFEYTNTSSSQQNPDPQSDLTLNMYTLARSSKNTSYNNGQYVTSHVKTIYKAGESFSSANLSANYENAEIALSDLTVTGYSNSVGSHEITVTYSGATAKYTVYVLADSEYYNVAVGANYAVGSTTTINSETYITFKTIEQALEYLRGFTTPTASNRANLYISAGYYNEKVVIDIPYLTISGAGMAKATYTNDEAYSSSEYSAATIIEWDSLYGVVERGFTNITDSTQTVYVTEAALYCEIKNLTISNWWNNDARFNSMYDYLKDIYYYDSSKSQNVYLASDNQVKEHRALALLVQADHFIMEGCSLLGYQDTVEFFTGRSYLKNCYVTGATDYIFGTNATVYFKNSTIHTIYNGKSSQGGYVNAFKGQNASSSDAITYGCIYDGCTFEADSNVANGIIALGRPWTTSSAVMIMNSTISAKYSKDATASTSVGRYCDWNSSILAADSKFYEYNNTGDGALSSSVTGMTLVSSSVAADYNTLSKIFGTSNGGVTYSDSWNGTTTPETDDNTYYYFDGTTSSTGTAYYFTGDLQNKTGSIGDMTVDATNGGKFSYNTGGYTQFNQGTTLTITVTQASHIVVESFTGQYNYTICDGTTTYTANSDTYSIDVAANSTVVVTATATAYLYKLCVDPIK
ncbi:MAG: InlB B-repeat-containing protein [Acholeplasmatales bacterium]|nr:InlB B-repeat-containing protein [Acholeplasmatales bacterium]